MEEAERDGLVGAENANEKEKGKYKIHKVKIQTTRYKIQSKEDVEKSSKQRWRRWGEVEIL